MEKQKALGEPLHLLRCLGELCVMYVNEKHRDFVAMMDDAEDVWGDYDD